MRKIVASLMIIVSLFSFASCSYRVKNESRAEYVYTCPSDNMYGLEKAVVFDDGIVLVFDKKASDNSEHVKFDEMKKDDDLYGIPVEMHDTRHKKPHVRSSFVEKNGKYIASAFYYDEDTARIDINGMTLFAKVVDVNNGNFLLTYDTYEYVTDGFERVTQRFDASTGEWGEVERDFISCWSEG